VTIDLPRWTLDADWSLEAASAASGQRGPRLGLVFRGPIDHPERRIDVRAFVDHLNMRRFEREVERLEALQRDIDQRERVLREIQERERERREQEERERARREEEERARQAPQPVQPERPAQAPPARTPGSAAEERSRFNDLIRDALRAPAAPNAPAAGLSPLPPPVVIAPAPGAAPTRPAGRPIELVPSR
jgi:TolA-binding protein